MKPYKSRVNYQGVTPDIFCPICQQKIFLLSDYPGWRDLAEPLRFREIGECYDCQLGIGIPVYDQSILDSFYKKGDFWRLIGTSTAQISHERNQSRHRIQFCLKYMPRNARVLDVGAGHGWIAKSMDEQSLEISSYDFIEPDSHNSNSILSRVLRFPVCRVASIEQMGGQYDFIFLNHILEHVSNPVHFLSKVKANLKPGGIIYIESPNGDHLFKKNVFPHTLFFSKKSFNAITNKLEMDILEAVSFGNRKAVQNTFLQKFLHLMLDIVSRVSMWPLECFADDLIWKYDQPSEQGIWLRLIVRKKLI